MIMFHSFLYVYQRFDRYQGAKQLSCSSLNVAVAVEREASFASFSEIRARLGCGEFRRKKFVGWSITVSWCINLWIILIYIYVYIWAGTPTPPPSPSQMVPLPPCGRGGGVFSAAKPIYAKYIAQCKECASNVQGTAWAALVSIHRNHGVCSLYSAYSAYSAYASIIRMDILYVI